MIDPSEEFGDSEPSTAKKHQDLTVATREKCGAGETRGDMIFFTFPYEIYGCMAGYHVLEEGVSPNGERRRITVIDIWITEFPGSPIQLSVLCDAKSPLARH